VRDDDDDDAHGDATRLGGDVDEGECGDGTDDDDGGGEWDAGSRDGARVVVVVVVVVVDGVEEEEDGEKGDDARDDDEKGWTRRAIGRGDARGRDAGFRGDGERTIEKVLHGGGEGRRGEDVVVVVVGGEVCGGGTSHVGRVHGSRALVERFSGAKRARGDAGGGERHEWDVVRVGD